MPAVTPIPPWAMKEILTLYGWVVKYEDDYNWILDDPRQPTAEPLVLPRLGDALAVEVMMDTLLKSTIPFGTYLALKEKVLGADWHFLSAAQMKAKAPAKPN